MPSLLRPLALLAFALPALVRAQTPAAETAFTLSDRAFAAEGLAHDAATGSFFVGSVHLGRIERVDAAGVAAPFATAPGNWSVLGMTVDTARGALWAATANMPQSRDADATLRGWTSLVRFNLTTGAVERTYEQEGTFGDVAVGPDGSVYVTDGMRGTLHVLDAAGRAAADTLRLLLPRGTLHSTQGLAFGHDPYRLFVADYRYGIVAVDTRSGTTTIVPMPAGLDRRGIDGLTYADGALYAVQNGVRPYRVWRFRLSNDETRVTAADVLASADGDARFDEPTLGVVVGPWLYVMAVSGWGHFSDAGTLDTAAAPPPLVVRVAR